MKKIFVGTWIVVSIIFFFFSPWNYFNPCYGEICSDAIAQPVFSITPNFMHPACTGLCINPTDILVFSLPNFIFDIFCGLIFSVLVILLLIAYKKKTSD